MWPLFQRDWQYIYQCLIVLNKEPAAREGIEVIEVNPQKEFKITTGQKEMKPTGPAIILINQDQARR